MKKATTTLFAQLVGMMPRSILEGIAAQFYKPGNASKFTVWDQLVALVFCHIRRVRLAAEIEDGLYPAPWVAQSRQEAPRPSNEPR